MLQLQKQTMKRSVFASIIHMLYKLSDCCFESSQEIGGIFD